MRLPHVEALAREQGSAVSRDQCLQAGLTRSSLATLLKTCRWQRVFPGVYAVHSGPLSDETRVWAAWLLAGMDAAVSHQSALWLARGCKGGGATPVHVSIPRNRIVQPPRGVVVHRFARSSVWGGSPPRMEASRAVVEATHVAATEQAVVAILCGAVGDRLVSSATLRAELGARKRHRWRKLLDAMLADVAVGAQSPLELADLRNDRAHGLPAGERQVSMRVGGANRWLDVRVSVPGSAVVVVKELDGRLGHEGIDKFRDMVRDNDAVLRGGTPLRFGWLDYRPTGCDAAAYQSLVWRRHGVDTGHACRADSCGLTERIERLAAEHPRWDAA